jgi:hypothetical protein
MPHTCTTRALVGFPSVLRQEQQEDCLPLLTDQHAEQAGELRLPTEDFRKCSYRMLAKPRPE